MQVVIVVTTPIIARLYLPEHFGIFQIIESLIVLLMSIACLRFELSIPLGKNQQEILASFIVSLLFSFGVTTCCLLAVVFGRESIARQFNTPQLVSLLWFLPGFAILYGFTNALTYWASREGKFGIIAWSGVGNALCEKLLIVIFGYFFKASAIGLLIGRFIGVLVNMGILFHSLKRKLWMYFTRSGVSFVLLRDILVKHKKFPLFSFWAALITVLSMQLPTFFLGMYYSPTIVGFYSLAYRVVWLQNTLLGQSITQLFFPTAAQEFQETGSIANIVKNIFKRLVQISAFPFIVLLFLAPVLFNIVFGQTWEEAGIYAQLLTIWSFIALIHQPLTVFEILDLQEANLLVTIIMVLGRASSLYIGVLIGPPRFVIGFFVIISTATLLGSLAWKFKVSQVSWWWAGKTVIQYVLLSSFFVYPIKLLSLLTENVILLLGTLGIATILYGGVLFHLDPSCKPFISKFLKKLKRNK